MKHKIKKSRLAVKVVRQKTFPRDDVESYLGVITGLMIFCLDGFNFMLSQFLGLNLGTS